MSTRSFIGMQYENGTIRAIYCHYDGYINGGVGETLFWHFQDADKINKLLEGSDISSLGSRIDASEGHSFDNRQEGCTVFYARDRGEVRRDPSEYFTSPTFLRGAKNVGAIYAYLFADGEWFVCNVGTGAKDLIPLAPCFDSAEA